MTVTAHFSRLISTLICAMTCTAALLGSSCSGKPAESAAATAASGASAVAAAAPASAASAPPVSVSTVRAQMARDEAALADAQRQLARSRELLAQNFVSQGALDANQTLVASDRAALDAARIALAFARVLAPGAGRVGAIAVFPGGAVTASLPEGAGSFTGRLQFVDNAVDAASGSVRVKAVFENHDYKLWPGAFANVKPTVRTLKEAVVIAQAAIIQSPR